MANMSNYLEKQLLNHLFRGANYASPSKLWIALCTDTLDDTIEEGSELPEVEGGDYQRKSIDSSTAAWTEPDLDGVTKNIAEIKWENVTWEATVKAIAICTAGPARATGKVLFWGDLTKEKVVTEDDSVSFAANALSIQIDN